MTFNSGTMHLIGYGNVECAFHMGIRLIQYLNVTNLITFLSVQIVYDRLPYCTRIELHER